MEWLTGRWRALKANALKAVISLLLFAIAMAIALSLRTWATALPAGADQEFWVGVSSSLLEDSAFFFIVALTVSLMFAPEPENRNLEARVRYLYDGRHVTAGARAYMATVVQEKAAIAKSLNVRLVVTARDAGMKALKIEDNRVSNVANMFHREDYEDTLDVKISTDELIPPPADRKYGGISEAFVMRGVTKDDLVKFEVPILKKETMERKFFLKLQPNEEVSYHYKTWVWNLLSESFWVSGSKYTEQLSIDIRNETGGALTIVMVTPDNNPPTSTTLQHSEEKQFAKLEKLFPSSKVSFKFT